MSSRGTTRAEDARTSLENAAITQGSVDESADSAAGRERAVEAFLANWIVQARKGLLELSVLRALEDRERYGYEIVRDMIARPGLGGAEGTVYPMLARLRDHGLLVTTLRESEEGPARKYYALTPAGRSALNGMRDRFRELIAGVLREGEHADPPAGTGRATA